jgi:hypothetical protein
MVDTTSDQQKKRYKAYKDGAEFDGFPDLTRRGWLGKMRIGDAEIELPSKLEYLHENADGDGVSLPSSIELTASNIFQTKFHVLVADFQGLSDVRSEELSLAEAQELNPRATIKQYTRESLVDWQYERINGVMQLSYMRLWERCCKFNRLEQSDREYIDSYLILMLDEDGNYFQQKEVDGELGERNYITVNGQPLKFIPAEIVSDEQNPVGCIPKGMGMLYDICELSLSRYRVSADYKETMRRIAPTITTSGWTQNSFDLFKELNGKDYMELGATSAVNLPNDVTMDVLNPSISLEGFERYFEKNTDKVKALGGVFKGQQSGNMTATEADINAAELNANLETVADSLESSYKRVIFYCGIFEGLYSPDADLPEDIIVSLPRDFATPKLSVEEVRTLVDLVAIGVRTREQVVKALAQGGWDYQDAEATINELLEAGPSVSSLANEQVANTGTTS